MIKIPTQTSVREDVLNETIDILLATLIEGSDNELRASSAVLDEYVLVEMCGGG